MKWLDYLIELSIIGWRKYPAAQREFQLWNAEESEYEADDD